MWDKKRNKAKIELQNLTHLSMLTYLTQIPHRGALLRLMDLGPRCCGRSTASKNPAHNVLLFRPKAIAKKLQDVKTV